MGGELSRECCGLKFCFKSGRNYAEKKQKNVTEFFVREGVVWIGGDVNVVAEVE